MMSHYVFQRVPLKRSGGRMKLPSWLLRLLPMWDYVCPKCRQEVPKNSSMCPHCCEVYGSPLRIPAKVLKDPKGLEDYVHKHIFPRVSAWQQEYLAEFFTEFFNNGFEEGDFSAWTATSMSGDATVSVVSSKNHHGTYSAYAENLGSRDTDIAYCYKTLSDNGTFYLRFYLYLDNVDLTTSYTFLGGMTNATGAANAFAIGLFSSTRNLYLGFRNAGTWMTTSSSTTLSLDTWYCIELKWYRHAANGEVRVYLNGAEVADLAQTQLDTNTGLTSMGRARVGICLTGSGGFAGDVYIDCAVVADAYIGPEAGAVLKEVADLLSLGDSVLCGKSFSVSDSVGVVDDSLRDWSPQVADVVGVSDVVLLSRLFQVLDVLSSSDLASVDKALSLEDLIGLGDNAYVNKLLEISDFVALAEVVEKGVGGAAKTRIFLILGDVAIQLTG